MTLLQTEAIRRDVFVKQSIVRDTSISTDAFCLTELGLKRARTLPVQRRLKLVMNGKRHPRDFALMEISAQPYWADLVTGSLYRIDGTSPSGSRLRVVV